MKPLHIEIFSPSPIQSSVHTIDIAPTILLNRFHSHVSASWRAIPVPASVHGIDKMPPEHKKHIFPILPSTDFLLARMGKGPDCHRYEREFTDLKFVATIGCITWGLSTFNPDIKTPEDLIGKKIGVEAEGGAPRVLSDAVLRDAWGIYDKVEIKDYHPPQVKIGLLSGDIDATFWIQTWETVDGFACSDMDILDERQVYWVGLSLEDIDRINRANPFKLHRQLMPRGSIRATGQKADPPEDVGLPGFALSLCAWDDSEEELIYEMVRFLDEKSELWPDRVLGCPFSLARMAKFPGITEDMVHPGALRYYQEKAVEIGMPVQLLRIGE